jgi:exodeoxyribonuclease VII large subunit
VADVREILLNLLRMNYKAMEKEFVDLFEFQSKLKEGIECLFPKRIWLRAEISAVKARQGSHCWLELSQSNAEGLIAKASAVIWSSKYRFIAPYFQSVTGSPLKEGMVVLVEVQANYSQLYGFSLVINDIDPEYSLGLKELERQRTIERLQKEGLMDLQKELTLALLPHRLAVVSAEDAAGFRDFVRHLDDNPYGFRMDVTLFPALMQGSECPSSVISAMDAVLECGEDFDAVLILRGGGSKLDLACFDDYRLASVIAQYPLPVLTAIGHDQDYHVCDMVAHSYLKTPTALADEILSIYEDEDARLSSFMTRIRMAASGRLAVSDSALSMLRGRIRNAFALKIASMESALGLLHARISAADPRKLLERGFALALDSNGVRIKVAAGVCAGDKVSVLFPDGTLKCTVDDVERE